MPAKRQVFCFLSRAVSRVNLFATAPAAHSDDDTSEQKRRTAITTLACFHCSCGGFSLLSSPVPRHCAMTDEKTRSDALAMHKKFEKIWGGLPTVCSADLPSLPSGTVIVDVRTKDEIDVSRIPNSLTVEEFQAARQSGAEPPAVVSVCTVGVRASLWAHELRKGFAGPVYIHQGILLHALDGNSVVRKARTGGDGKGSTWTDVKEVHTFDKAHEYVPSGWNAKHYSAFQALRHAAPYVPKILRFMTNPPS